MQNTELFSHFRPILIDLTRADLDKEIERPDRLVVAISALGRKKIEVAYAPFDHINQEAVIVIVGITPGRQQMRDALLEAHRVLKAGGSDSEAAAGAKVFASFSGPMRSNLVSLLDGIGINKVLGLESTGSLWGKDSSRVQFTSALRYPVFIDGANYSGTPAIASNPFLIDQLRQWFLPEMAALSNAIFVPLGPQIGYVLERAAELVGVDRNRILSGLPHPSGANAERIAYFLGRKERAALSAKVAPDLIERNRELLQSKVAALAA
ncbi:uracil-DNA glycosylase family protein [Mesorhizobium sp. BR1-1-14]|uniref:uracil-DNA glycosylase family protein n=1 Tax=Mesorhizobium sp. BR1-1-14 TaxID=2876655 RepID=UPI001CD066A5|nr:uracil-DNA glycosylase family protein [Mesorhizobium sp. BR1-1-14]MBZ9960612.1 uracil-DNA glycosylase family protein [Mesorhizobium sp. BR1-1-14]